MGDDQGTEIGTAVVGRGSHLGEAAAQGSETGEETGRRAGRRLVRRMKRRRGPLMASSGTFSLRSGFQGNHEEEDQEQEAEESLGEDIGTEGKLTAVLASEGINLEPVVVKRLAALVKTFGEEAARVTAERRKMKTASRSTPKKHSCFITPTATASRLRVAAGSE